MNKNENDERKTYDEHEKLGTGKQHKAGLLAYLEATQQDNPRGDQ